MRLISVLGRRGKVAIAVAGLVLAAVIAFVVAGPSRTPRRVQSVPPASTSVTPTSATSAAASSTATNPPTASTSTGSAPRPQLVELPRTVSADVYAAAAARALWGTAYATTPRDVAVGMWQRELLSVLPADVPVGTTLAQAQAAGLATVEAYLPTAGVWAGLAQDRTVSSFVVTGVSEPPSWVTAVTTGQITDPGLTARTVVGVQTISYGTGRERRTTRQSQQLTLAMLCPPTTPACQVVVFEPPDDQAGTSW